MAWGAVIGAVGAVAGGIISSNAADRAADHSEEAARRKLDYDTDHWEARWSKLNADRAHLVEGIAIRAANEEREAAYKDAFIAPSFPIATVPTGIPLGIWTIDNKLSKPLSFLLSIGTPMTGIGVIAAIIPGKWAEPPAPAIITEILFFWAFFANSNNLFGVLWADTILVSKLIFKYFNESSAYFIVE